jgi:hypothetical protein
LESDPQHQETAKNILKDVFEKDPESAIDAESLSTETKKLLESGGYKLTVSSHPKTHHDVVMVLPEGKVQEKLPLKPSFSDQIVSSLKK